MSEQVRELGDTVKATADDDDVNVIGDMANKAGESIAAEARDTDDKSASKKKS